MAGTAKVWVSSIDLKQSLFGRVGRQTNDGVVNIAIDFVNKPHEVEDAKIMLLQVHMTDITSLNQAVVDALQIAARFADDLSKECQKAIAGFAASRTGEPPSR